MQDDSVRTAQISFYTNLIAPDGLVRITSFHRPKKGPLSNILRNDHLSEGNLFFKKVLREPSPKGRTGGGNQGIRDQP
jgi:hypothetical protein